MSKLINFATSSCNQHFMKQLFCRTKFNGIYAEKCSSFCYLSIVYCKYTRITSLLLSLCKVYSMLTNYKLELLLLTNKKNYFNFLLNSVLCVAARSGSQATLDSLDISRLSEDGERGVDERVAVLEFELRKARETINALRANLTVATGSVLGKPYRINYCLV